MDFFNKFPAAVLDLFQLAQGQPSKYTRNMRKLKNYVDGLSYFTLNQWDFVSNNKLIIWRSMSAADRKVNHFSSKTV